jgi:hypothetical protein
MATNEKKTVQKATVKKAVKQAPAKKIAKAATKKAATKKAEPKKAAKKDVKKATKKAAKAVVKTAVQKKAVQKAAPGKKPVAAPQKTLKKIGSAPIVMAGRKTLEELEAEKKIEIRKELARKPHAGYPTDSKAMFNVEARKFELEQPSEQAPRSYAPPRELDSFYGDTCIYALVRDPEWLYVYWEIANDTRAQFGIEYGRHSKHLALRWHDITDLAEFNGFNAHKYFDVDVTDDISAWYQRMPEAKRVWCVDFGIKEPDGSFTLVCRSHHAPTPPMEMASDELPLDWVFVDPADPRRIFRIPAGASIREILKAANIAEELLRRLRLPAGLSLEEKRRFYENLVGQELSSYLLAQPGGAPSADLSSWILTQRVSGSERKR